MPLPPRVGFGWRMPTLPKRGLKTPFSSEALKCLPEVVSFEPFRPPVRNQEWLGACTGFAFATAVDCLVRRALKDGLWLAPKLTPSPLWIYYHERVLEGREDVDCGATLTDGLTVVAQGIADEREWPYDPAEMALRPTVAVEFSARQRRAINGVHLAHDLDTICGMLAMGFPVVIGVAVYQQFMGAPQGIVDIPEDDAELLGGHAICLVGYDRTARTFTFQNSWGEGWGMGGMGSIPFDYVANAGLCGELVTLRAIRTVEPK